LDTTLAADVQAQAYESLGHIENLPWIGLAFPMSCSRDSLARLNRLPLRGWQGHSRRGTGSKALIVGRAVARLEGAAMYLGQRMLLQSAHSQGVLSTPREAPTQTANTDLSWRVGCILGPVIGGVIPSAVRPGAGHVVVAFKFGSQAALRPDLKALAKLKDIGWIEAPPFAAFVVLFIMVLNFDGSILAWKSGGSIALEVVLGVCLIASRSSALKSTTFLCFFGSRTIVLLYVASGTTGATPDIVLFYSLLFSQFANGATATQAAVCLPPFICFVDFLVLVTGGSLPLVGRHNLYYVVRGCVVLIGGVLLCTGH
ncbi:hypothetical protein LLEC1_02084, partial [Akanthomyces lecanii]